LSECPNCRQPIFPDDVYCGSCGHPLQAAAAPPVGPPPSPIPTAQIPCPTCGHMNEPDAIYCENDGAPLRGPPPSPQGVLIMPDQTEMPLSQARITLGRSNLVRYLRPEQATEVSRAHFTITQDGGAYYLQDGGPDPSNPQVWKPSVNQTRLNGMPLQPGEKKPLKSNDIIDVAGIVQLTFRSR